MSREELPLAAPRTQREIEHHATQFLEKFYPQCLKEPQPTPVQHFLEIVIPKHRPVEFNVMALPYPLEAVTVPGTTDESSKVFLDSNVYENLCDGQGRARFTAGHESYHAIVHVREIQRKLANGRYQGLYRRAQIPWNRNPERQANIFAAALLMPASMVRLALQHIGPNVRLLAETFRVSPSAMEVRLGELRVR